LAYCCSVDAEHAASSLAGPEGSGLLSSPMSWTPPDARTWSTTDRPGERLTIARPLPDIEVHSVAGSNRHWRDAHDSYTLAVIHRDQAGLRAEWRTRGRSMSARAGDIMAIEPGDVHVTERLEFPLAGADFDIVRLSPGLVAEAARELGVSGHFHFEEPTSSNAVAFDALRSLVEGLAAGQGAQRIEALSLAAVHAVISNLGERQARPASLRNCIADYRLRRLKDYLHAHVERRPTLDELETVTQLSKWRLCVVFEQTYGTSIGSYWRALRAREASRRLLRGTPIKMIVAELGYADSPHFSREFRAHYGLSPAKWLALGGGSLRKR
jgi:AraC-like DNA-binding protein